MIDMLSQAERTAMEGAMLPENRDISMRSPRLTFEAGWLAAHDYFKAGQLRLERDREAAVAVASESKLLQRAEKVEERERVLWNALDSLFGAAKPYLDKAAPHERLFDGGDLRNFEALSRAIVQADLAFAASPGEPEGQRPGEPEGQRPVDSDGRPLCFECGRPQSEHEGGIECQPVHGPGAPSEDEGRFFADRLLAEQFHATLPDPHRWRIRDLSTGGYLLVAMQVGESNG